MIDEHLFLKEATFRKLIAPLYKVTKASLICISTASDKSGELTNMLKRTDKRGRSVVNNFRYSAVCQACQNKGIKEECDHEAHRMPPWDSLEKKEQLEIMFEGNKEDHAREILGVEVESNDAVFSSFLVDELFKATRHRNEEWVKRIFVAIDPNAGQHRTRPKGGSDFALVSIYETNHRTVLIGAEAIDAIGPEDFLPYIYEHLVKLKSFPGTRDATICVMAECDTGHEGGHLEIYLKARIPTKLFFMKETQNKVGGHTNENVKRDMAMKLRQRIGDRRLVISDDFISVAPKSQGKDVVLAKLKEQLIAYSEIREIPNDPTGVVKVKYSGKRGGKRDDLAVAMQLVCYWGDFVMGSGKYDKEWS